jgi:hypothetical protein
VADISSPRCHAISSLRQNRPKCTRANESWPRRYLPVNGRDGDCAALFVSEQIPKPFFDAKSFDRLQGQLQGDCGNAPTAQPRLVGSREPRSISARGGPLSAIGVARWHARLVGVVVRAVLSETVPRFEVDQSEPMRQRDRLVCKRIGYIAIEVVVGGPLDHLWTP